MEIVEDRYVFGSELQMIQTGQPYQTILRQNTEIVKLLESMAP